MRRLIAIAGCVAVLFVTAGCGSESEPSAASSSGAPSASASPSGTSNKEICDQVKAINTQYAATITTTFQKMTDQAVKGDDAGAKVTLDQLNALTREWAGKVEPLVAKTNDPDLKKALNDLVTGVKKLESGDASLNDMQKTLTDANTALAKYCA